jgi:multidrug resistance efflux pump
LLIIILTAFFINNRFESIANTKPAENLDQLIKKFGVPVETVLPGFEQKIDETKTFTGVIKPFSEIEISAKIADVITETTLKIGKKVKKDELVLKISDSIAKTRFELAKAVLEQARASYDKVIAGARPQEIAQAQAQVKSAQAQFKNAEKEYKRMGSLTKNNAIPMQQADKITAAYESAKAAYESAKEQLSLLKEGARKEDISAAKASLMQARAQFELAELNLSYTIVKSPISGRISKIYKDLDEESGIGKPLFSVVDLNRVFLVTDIPENYINRIRRGMSVICSSQNIKNRTFKGEVHEISPAASPVSRSFSVKVLIDNKEELLKSGMFAQGEFILDSIENACTLPRAAVFMEKNKNYLYLIKADTAHKTAVSIMDIGNDRIAVFPKLEKNSPVVIKGIKDIRNSSKVRLISRAQ